MYSPTTKQMNPYRMLRKKTWTKGGNLNEYTHVNISHIQAIDQKKTKGCFLASLLYLQQFLGNMHHFNDFPTKKGYRNIEQGLKDFPELTKGIQHVRFRPQRTMRSTPKRTLETLKYLRNLIDTGHVFVAPFDGHFCTYIGYNQQGFIALGSYGGKGLHEIKETTLFADAIDECMYVLQTTTPLRYP